ncbi:MAG: inositol 2-dehydrogenase [Chloroflexi bacterium RBG_16_68_14]|nr:MAG: inositol 2-dehydrogenase [Chloroflexi bacterium RBG_16_68_14]
MSRSTRTRSIAVGLIGVGAIGRLHAKHLASRVPGASLAAVADIDRAAAEACAAECGSPDVYDQYHDLLQDPAVQAVVVCSPPDTHAQIIEEAAGSGKHVFCEKPLDCDLDKIDRALKAVSRAGVKLQVGFNRRFDANFRYVHEAVGSGKVGQPYTLRITSRDPQLPQASGSRATVGLFLDTMIHDFDMARYLTGSEVVSVYALADAMIEGSEEIDTAVATLRFASGVLGTIENGQTAYGYDQRVEVFGSKGAIAVENEKSHQVTLTDATGAHAALPLHFFVERYSASYIAELSAFVDCILGDTEPLVTGADGRIAILIALAAQRSYEEGKPVVLGGSLS